MNSAGCYYWTDYQFDEARIFIRKEDAKPSIRRLRQKGTFAVNSLGRLISSCSSTPRRNIALLSSVVAIKGRTLFRYPASDTSASCIPREGHDLGMAPLAVAELKIWCFFLAMMITCGRQSFVKANRELFR